MRTVSVIMPCFNHSRFIRESVDSVLGQTHRGIELIVVDDCSLDDSWGVIASLAAKDSRITAIRRARNGGAARSRNDGIKASTGEFIAFCDADDLWEPQKVAQQLATLDLYADRALTFCDSLIVDENGALTGDRFGELWPTPKEESGSFFHHLVRTNFINAMGVMMRRECVERVGMFDEDLKGASLEDWWYWLQISHEFRFIYSDACLGRYRIHSGSSSRKHWRSYSVTRYKVFRRMLRVFPDLSTSVRASAWLSMGMDLCELGRVRTGRRLLWKAMSASMTSPQAYPVAARALRQLILRAASH